MPEAQHQGFMPQQHSQQMQANGLPFQPVRQTSGLKQQHHVPQQDTDVDDSGIGMSLMDDELTLHKFGVTGPHVTMEGMRAPDMCVDPL